MRTFVFKRLLILYHTKNAIRCEKLCANLLRMPSEGAVPLRLAHYPPVITCFRRVLEAPGSERATAAGEARHHAHAAGWRTQKLRRVRERLPIDLTSQNVPSIRDIYRSDLSFPEEGS